MENLSNDFQKQKNPQKTHEEIEFHNWFKIEFLLPFTGYRKALGKMPAIIFAQGTLQEGNVTVSVTFDLHIRKFCLGYWYRKICFIT